MRIIIELDPGAQVTTSMPRASVAATADMAAPIDAGPPRMTKADAPPSGGRLDTDAAEDIGGPPADLIAQIEAARERDRDMLEPPGGTRPF